MLVPETEPDHPLNVNPDPGDSLSDTTVPNIALKVNSVVTPLAAVENTCF
jgi:hypothetical protein